MSVEGGPHKKSFSNQPTNIAPRVPADAEQGGNSSTKLHEEGSSAEPSILFAGTTDLPLPHAA